MRTRNALLGLALLAMPAMATAQEMKQVSDEMPSEAEVQADVAAVDADFLAAFNSGDADAVAATYTEDARALPPGAPPMEGRDAIREYFAGGIAAMPGAKLAFETWESHAMGDGVVSIGGYTMTGPDGAHLDHGKYMEVFERTDDGLKIAHDMWNSSMAPQAAEGAMMKEHEEMMKKHEEMKDDHEKMKDHDDMDDDHGDMDDDDDDGEMDDDGM